MYHVLLSVSSSLMVFYELYFVGEEIILHFVELSGYRCLNSRNLCLISKERKFCCEFDLQGLCIVVTCSVDRLRSLSHCVKQIIIPARV
jgi:hypothetical protein